MCAWPCLEYALKICVLLQWSQVEARAEDDNQEHSNPQAEHESTWNPQISMAQYECFQRIVKEPHHKTKTLGEKLKENNLKCCAWTTAGVSLWALSLLAGPVCNMTWDGWLCWDETEAGVTTEQSCPEYFSDFDPKGDSFI